MHQETSQELQKKYEVPENLLQLAKNNESAFLTLKIVEIIGEDEPYNLDPETIYFIIHLLNQTNLKKIRNSCYFQSPILLYRKFLKTCTLATFFND